MGSTGDNVSDNLRASIGVRDHARKSVRIVERPVPELSVSLHENALVHRLLAARGICDPSELSCALADLPRPDTLLDIDKAVKRLLQARQLDQKILVVGDYDCDGATSTCVAVTGLAMLGFKHVDYFIPSRFTYGYGLSPAIVDVARNQFNSDLIVTVDNGVASVDGVERATELGIDVVVTDHHLAPAVLPKAVAIINPAIPGSTFAGKNLAGVGVIFYTLLAVRSELARLDDAFGRAPLAELLDLVAIGTVADVVPLDRINRTLVEQGLRRIRSGQTRPGVAALLKAAGRATSSLSTQDIGFGIGPRLNAAGRLDDMRIGVQCLLANSDEQAGQLADTLNELNQQRRTIERTMRVEADQQMNTYDFSSLAHKESFAVCLMDDQWHQGVIGILAGRIKESLHRPAIVFTADGEHNLKGSARSIPGVHIRDVLQTIVATHPGMIEKFGGHAMAAGLTLPRASFEPFKQAFEDSVRSALDSQYPEREYVCDGSLRERDRTLENARLLEGLMPWGQNFEAPLFVDHFAVVSHKIVGGGHLKLSLGSADRSAAALDAIAFNCTLDVNSGDTVRALYSLDVNTWRDRQSLQLRVLHIEHADRQTC